MDSFQPLLSWVELNPGWLVVAAGLIAFIESLAVIGIVIPGIVLLAALATTAASLSMNPIPVLVAAALGAMLGDNLSFWIGRLSRHKIEQHPAFLKYQPQFAKAQVFLNHKGAFAVILGRFLGPIRPFLPMVAGMMLMKPSLFLSLSIVSSVAWSPFYLLPAWYITTKALS